jgi:hypothetical protein
MKKKYIYFALISVLFLTSCAVYTEKRSQALSRAVAATADSIEAARFDLASKYSKEAEKIAYPPKERIIVRPIITKNTKSLEIKNTKSDATLNGKKTNLNTSIVKITASNNDEETVLRLVVPENLKHAKLLIENSDEWLELLKTKSFAEQLAKDNKNLKDLVDEVNAELLKQQEINSQLIKDLNKLQKEVIEKRLHILKLYIAIAILIAVIGGATYLRIKGIL